jgi:hypothetical protein
MSDPRSYTHERANRHRQRNVACRSRLVVRPARPNGAGPGAWAQRCHDRLGVERGLAGRRQNAVSLTGRPDGYFQNAAIKILMPSQLQPIEKGLRAVGYGPQLDELVLSMNRAAERAAPAAKPIFLEAITAMSFDDARRIVRPVARRRRRSISRGRLLSSSQLPSSRWSPRRCVRWA